MSEKRALELDHATLERAQRGDEHAFRTLAELYQGRVHALLGRMLPARQSVDDVAQETFFAVFTSLPGFDLNGSAKLSTWILKIATRKAFDVLRKRRPEVLLIPEETKSDEDVEEVVAARQLEQRMRVAMDALMPDFRAVLVLAAYHGMSYREIAFALDVEVGTVKSRLRRARNALLAVKKEAAHG